MAASFTAPTLVTLAEDLKKMELIVAVSESDIGRVEAGQTATFSVDAWPGRSYTAKVKKVAFGSANNQNAGNGNGNNANAGAAASGQASQSPRQSPCRQGEAYGGRLRRRILVRGVCQG